MSAHALSLADSYGDYTVPLKKDNGDEKDCANFLLALKYGGSSSSPSPPSPTSAVAVIPSSSRARRTKASNPKQQSYESDDASSSSPSLADELVVSSSNNIEVLLNKSPLVLPVDRDLVPDALFVAMAQMKPCALTKADRVGCYKKRELGYTGFACAHCGGQPGFGRYFPATVRSLAQTTTSQTILKHVSIKCRYVPQHIRKGIMTMQQQQAAAEASAVAGRPRYGSRKVFFQKFWNRLHSMTPPVLEDEPLHALPSPGSHDLVRMVSQPSSAASSSDEGGFSSGDEVGYGIATTRKGGLPVKKNVMKRRSNSVSKRQRWN